MVRRAPRPARYLLWIAAYPSGKGGFPDPAKKRAPAPWDAWTFWQFTDQGPHDPKWWTKPLDIRVSMQDS